MESLIIWVVVIFVSLIIVIPAIVKFTRQRSVDAENLKDALRLGATKTIAQHPQVDEMKCIGCGACVAACPEGDVLGMVGGRAVIINGLRCVGHGLCAEACPVAGLEVGLGDLSKRDDIPMLSQYNETSIARLFIAGELGGFALIKNAINQGREVGEYISGLQTGEVSGQDIRHVAIIGAGPAGMSAALSIKAAGLSYYLLDQQNAGGTILQYPRKKLVMTKVVDIPGYGSLETGEYSKEELLDIWEETIHNNSLELVNTFKMSGITRSDGIFHTQSESGEIYKSLFVILALGRRGSPRKLNVPGEDQSKVMYQLKEADSYQNNDILIVGGGDSAVEAAIGLSLQKGNKVHLSYRKDKIFRIKKRNEARLKEAVAEKRLNVIYESDLNEISKTSVSLKTRSGDLELKNDYVFIFAGGNPPFALLKKIGIQFGGESS